MGDINAGIGNAEEFKHIHISNFIAFKFYKNVDFDTMYTALLHNPS